MKLTISFLRSETSSSHLFMISCFSTIILFVRIGVSKIKVTNSKQKLANAIYHYEKRKPIIYKDDVTFCCFGLFGPRQHGVATSHRVSRNNVTQDSTITCQLQVSKKQPWTAIAISGVCKFSFSSNFTLSGRGLRYKSDINLT